MKNKTTAIVLAFFLGAFGAHQFYLGKKTKGWLYLLFFWTYVPALLAIIDIIAILVVSNDKFNELYN